MKKFIGDFVGTMLIWMGVYLNRPHDNLPLFSLNWWIVLILIIIGLTLIKISKKSE